MNTDFTLLQAECTITEESQLQSNVRANAEITDLGIKSFDRSLFDLVSEVPHHLRDSSQETDNASALYTSITTPPTRRRSYQYPFADLESNLTLIMIKL